MKDVTWDEVVDMLCLIAVTLWARIQIRASKAADRQRAIEAQRVDG